MASPNDLRPFHVFVAGMAAVLFLLLLLVHVVTWCEPKVPMHDLYAVYMHFLRLDGPYLLVVCALAFWVSGLFSKRPQSTWPYHAMLMFFPAYWFALSSLSSAEGLGDVLREPAGWWGHGRGRGHPLTEAQAFHAMWTSFRDMSVLFLGLAFVTAYVSVGSFVRAWWESRSRVHSLSTNDIVGEELPQ
jgi:hypothetical protein